MGRKKILTLAAGLFGALLVALRFAHLAADPPAMFIDLGEGLITDPYYYTYFARNAVLFGDWHLFDTEQFNIFQNSLISGAAYLSFSVFGVSTVAAHLASMILNIGGLLLLSLSIYDRERPALALYTTFFLLTNTLLFFYARFPLLENGLIFLCGAASYLIFRHGRSYTGLFLIGTLIALATLAGKLFGIVLLPAAIGTLQATNKERLKKAGIMIVGFLLSAVAYLTIITDGSPDTFLGYLLNVNQNIGSPTGRESIPGFLLMFWSYFATPGLMDFNFPIILIGLISAIILLVSRDDSEENDRIFRFASLWLLVALFVISPNDYRPARYGLFLFMPLSLLGGLLCQKLSLRDFKLANRIPYHVFPLIFIPISLIVATILMFGADRNPAMQDTGWFMPAVLILSILITALIALALRWRLLVTQTVRRLIVVVLLAVTLGQSAYFITEGLSEPRYDLETANLELSQQLPSGAVITGNYAPALTIDNRIKGVAYFFDRTRPDPDLLSKFPITHFVIAPELRQPISRMYAIREPFPPSFLAAIRGAQMNVYPINRPGYQPSNYERALQMLQEGNYVSSSLIADSLVEKYPDNRNIPLLKIETLIALGDIENAIARIETVGMRHPQSYHLLSMCAALSAKCYWITGNQEEQERVEHFLARAKTLHPRLLTTRDEILEMTKPR